jgi:hypothetical protein
MQVNGYAQSPLPAAAATSPEASKAAKPAATVLIGPASSGPTSVRTFRFANATSVQEQSEILMVIKGVISPAVRVTSSFSQGMLVAEGTDAQLADIQKLVDSLDKPLKRSYRLTYTIIDLDGTKHIGDQHYSMMLVPGQRTVLKQGNKVPIITGAYEKDSASKMSTVTYLDVGMDFDATLDEARDVLRLKTKVVRSSVVEDRMGASAVDDPIVRQSVFEGTAMLAPGKPQTIGSLDIIGSTRRVEIQVMAEPITF